MKTIIKSKTFYEFDIFVVVVVESNKTWHINSNVVLIVDCYLVNLFVLFQYKEWEMCLSWDRKKGCKVRPLSGLWWKIIIIDPLLASPKLSVVGPNGYSKKFKRMNLIIEHWASKISCMDRSKWIQCLWFKMDNRKWNGKS